MSTAVRVAGAVEFEQAVEELRDELLPLARDARHLCGDARRGDGVAGVRAHVVLVHRGTSTPPARLRVTVEYLP